MFVVGLVPDGNRRPNGPQDPAVAAGGLVVAGPVIRFLELPSSVDPFILYANNSHTG